MSAPILQLSRLAWPAAWNQIYDREAPLFVEIGFGNGEKLVEFARLQPSANVLGIEISLPSLRRGARKIAGAGLINARVLQGDSTAALWLLFKRESIRGVTINFPDPWPKAAHQHRRLISEQFLHLLATRMAPQAPLDVATDHVDYATAITQALAQTPYFESRLNEPYTRQVDGRIPTKYEKTGLAEGRIPYYFLWRRNELPAADLFLRPEERPVPHIVLQSPIDLEEIGRRFAPMRLEQGGIHLSYLAMYRSVEGDALLVDVYISEEPYHQRVGLSIRRRKEGDLVISLQEIGFPRPTPGAHLAVGRLVSWLQEQDPGMQIVNSTLVTPGES